MNGITSFGHNIHEMCVFFSADKNIGFVKHRHAKPIAYASATDLAFMNQKQLTLTLFCA